MNIRLTLAFLGMLAVGHAAQDPEDERLTFETKNAELTLEPDAQTADIKFPFTNNSDNRGNLLWHHQNRDKLRYRALSKHVGFRPCASIRRQ